MALTKVSESNHHKTYSAAAVDATGTNSSDLFPAASFTNGTVQAVWASITGTATFELQASCDHSNFEQIGGTSFTTSGASGSKQFNISSLPGDQIKLVVTSAAGAGTITPTFCFKRQY